MKRFITAIGFALVPTTALAVSVTDYWDCSHFLHCGDGSNAVTLLTTSIINGVYAFIVAAAVAAFLYGAIRMIMSEGGEGKEAGKKSMQWAAIGLVFAVLTYNGNRIIGFILELIGSFA